ncbi:unnamed protein product [Polarella glacialis]|uniref:Uncharacterized protein n=1 Tax=Polarella glacialis TaxID=89957 RepID=A0A813HSF8_POLGL|nr:unnamed protein product [Polarella glacialis]
MPGKKQQALSRAIDEAGHDARLSGASVVDHATLQSECEPGARAFWQAVPSRVLDLAVDPAEFIVEISSRLCMQECAVDQWCPLCDAVLDSRGHHSRMCCAGGDRTRRRNGLRNRIFRGAARAGLHPELERPGLLLPSRPGDINQNEQARRPADVYLPCFTGGLPAALDFAVTAPQRQETLYPGCSYCPRGRL